MGDDRHAVVALNDDIGFLKTVGHLAHFLLGSTARGKFDVIINYLMLEHLVLRLHDRRSLGGNLLRLRRHTGDDLPDVPHLLANEIGVLPNALHTRQRLRLCRVN